MRRGIIAWLVLCAGRVLFCIEARSEPESGEFCRNTGVVKAGRVACDDTLKQETGIRELPEELLMKLLQLYENGEGPGEEYSEELADFFRQALDRPLNINNIELKDLDKFFFLSSFQKEAILEYRREYGEFVSLNELFNIPGIERWQAELMLPFISPQGGGELLPLNLPALWRDARIQLLSRFKFIPEKQQGFTPVSREEYQKKPDCRYAGAPGYLYAQLKYECRDLVKICITSEKDPGEPGVDYLSASLLLHTKGVTERIVAGSYSARFGQGLVLWNSFPATLETQPSSLCKKESAILPYNSTGENDSFCGVAVTLRFKESDISIMTSYRGYDARITEEGFTSLLTTGLHNTATTFSRRKNLYGTVAGFNLNYRGSGFTVSQTTLLYRYDHPYAGRDSVKIKKWGEAGAWGGNASLSWYKVCKRVRVFGELAFDHGASAAVIAGITTRHGSRAESCLLFRSYSGSYIAPFSGALSAGSTPRGERGITVSVSGFAGKYSKGSLYTDIVKDRIKTRLLLEYKPEKGSAHTLRLDYSNTSCGVRYVAEIPLTTSLSLQGRGELRFPAGEKGDRGYLVLGELLCRPLSRRYSASVRLAWFDVPDWDSRIYAYERDLLYAFSVPVCYGKALRGYINLHLPLHKSFDLWIKASQVRYFDRTVIGEGNDLIGGPVKSELKFQIRLRF